MVSGFLKLSQFILDNINEENYKYYNKDCICSRNSVKFTQHSKKVF